MHSVYPGDLTRNAARNIHCLCCLTVRLSHIRHHPRLACRKSQYIAFASMQATSTACSCSYLPASINRKHSASQLFPVLHASGRSSRRQGRRRQALRSVAALSPDQLHDLLPQILHHASLAYERVTLPCSAMNCGDVVYKRSDIALADTKPQLYQYSLLVRQASAQGLARINLNQAMMLCSTLDPVLRMEQTGINPKGVGLIALALAYLTATPGIMVFRQLHLTLHNADCHTAPLPAQVS